MPEHEGAFVAFPCDVLELLAGEGEKTTSAFDCFLLIDGPFMPRVCIRCSSRVGLNGSRSA